MHQVIKTGMRSFPSGAQAGQVPRLLAATHESTLPCVGRSCTCPGATHRDSRSPPLLLQCTPPGAARGWGSCVSGCWAGCAASPLAAHTRRGC